MKNNTFFQSLDEHYKESWIKCIRECDGNRERFAKKLIDASFTRSELASGSCDGSALKKKLNPEKLALIKEVTFLSLPAPGEEGFTWNKIKELINVKCRGISRHDKLKVMNKED